MHLRWGLAVWCAALAGLASATARQPPTEVIRIWPGQPPGTESWTGPESELDADIPPGGKVHVVTNVTIPTLTTFRPARPSGTAMLVVPGGAFRALAWDLEGTEVAKWLATRGITAFLLKYRVRPPTEKSPPPQSLDDFARQTKAAREIALADAQQALRHIRANASKYGIASNRVGIIGFSAGAMTAMSAVLSNDAPTPPDFVVSAYGAILDGQVPRAGSPPLFIVAAEDDPQVPPKQSAEMFERWSAARLPVEIHVYERGGHGFGMRAYGLPVDAWPAAMEAWLRSRGLIDR